MCVIAKSNCLHGCNLLEYFGFEWKMQLCKIRRNEILHQQNQHQQVGQALDKLCMHYVLPFVCKVCMKMNSLQESPIIPSGGARILMWGGGGAHLGIANAIRSSLPNWKDFCLGGGGGQLVGTPSPAPPLIITSYIPANSLFWPK